MPLTKEQARAMAEGFLEASRALGTYRFDHWADLAPAERRRLEDAEWELLNHANAFVTAAVGLALQDMERDLKTIAEATGTAREAIGKINAVKNVLTIASALLTLCGAIASHDPGAIADAAKAAVKSVKDASAA
jgi:hypothetical protein